MPLLGDAVMVGLRYLFRNSIASSRERIGQAKDDWRARRFGTLARDETEFIPLPEERVVARAEDREVGAGSPTR